MKVTIVGAGFVGLTFGAILSNTGVKVTCLDVNAEKIDNLKSGRAGFYEIGLDQYIQQGIESGKLTFTTDYFTALKDSSMAVLTVGTPEKPDGSVNLSYIESAATGIMSKVDDGFILVTKSTVPVGTGRWLIELSKKHNKKIHVLSYPEFLAEGSAVLDTLNMDRVVVGGDSKEAKQTLLKLVEGIDKLAKKTDLQQFVKYAGIYKKQVKKFFEVPFKDRVVDTSLESAEMVKVAANAFLATKISFANLIGQICAEVGADVVAVTEAMGRDPRIGKDYLYPGLGWGGSCFPKDVNGLYDFANRIGVDASILKSTVSINSRQVDRTFELINQLSSRIAEKSKQIKVAILGLSFKPGTSDIRYSQSLKLIEMLEQNPQLKIVGYDPQANAEVRRHFNGRKLNFSCVDSFEDAAKDSSIMVLATEWEEFVKADYKKIKNSLNHPILIDTRYKLDKETLQNIGYEYYRL